MSCMSSGQVLRPEPSLDTDARRRSFARHGRRIARSSGNTGHLRLITWHTH